MLAAMPSIGPWTCTTGPMWPFWFPACRIGNVPFPEALLGLVSVDVQTVPPNCDVALAVDFAGHP